LGTWSIRLPCREMLEGDVEALEKQRVDPQAVLDCIEKDPTNRHPAQVARWGLACYDAERDAVDRVAATWSEDAGSGRLREPPAAGIELSACWRGSGESDWNGRLCTTGCVHRVVAPPVAGGYGSVFPS
jgi:hypothetical protein